ncbi:MAG TPA: MJ0042-type zinc finger domain-containing protein [Gemmata sp.]|nr:MJ0042-type zinc finger domain-containing protein [Gemmata sp.]
MNNACPTCGAVYAVATKDIGRKIKCKKCNTALLVDDTGLVLDAPVAVAVAAPAGPADDFETGDDAAVAKKKSRKYSDRGPALGSLLAAVGGVPTILFAVGVFLIIWFTFMPVIGEAATLRATEYPKLLKHEMDLKIKALVPRDKQNKEGIANLTAEEQKQITDKSKPIVEDYSRRIAEAEEDAEETRITNKRDVWFEQNGTMFGFLFLAFGCIGYLRGEQGLILRIVAAVILTFMMLVVFARFGGCGGSMPKL